MLLPCRSISSFYIHSEMHAHMGNKICRSNLFALSQCRCNEHVRASAITRISCSKKNTFLIWLLHICSILRGIFTFCEMTPIWRYLNAFYISDLLAGQWTCTSCTWNRRTRAYWETTSRSLLRYLWPILSQCTPYMCDHLLKDMRMQCWWTEERLKTLVHYDQDIVDKHVQRMSFWACEIT